MKKNEEVIIIYDKNAENIEKKILKIFEKYLEINMSKMGWQKFYIH